MKNVYILGGVLIAVAIGGYIYQNSTQEKIADPATVAAVEERAILTPLSADVEMTSLLDQEAWKVVADVSEVEDGAGVRTSAEGRAIIANDLEIITSLDSNSEIRLALSPDKKQTRVELTAGKTWTKIERALEQDEVYEVYTPTMVAAVRGTSFGVSLDPTKSLVVTEGTVRVQQRDPETGKAKPETEVLVLAGNTLEDDGAKFTVRETIPADRDKWYVENNPEDGETPVEMIQIDPPQLIIPPGGLTEPVACTADVFQCPDGSFVSRVAPSCEFAACPVTEEPVACTADAMICPDGTTVVREGPSCEFAACPAVEESVVLKIDDVDPTRFDPRIEDRVVVRGSGFDSVERVELNGREAEYQVTKDTVLILETYDLEEKDEVYDLKLFSADDSVELKDAFEVVLEEEEILLEIESITSGIEESMEFVIVRGPGMDIVDAVLVNNEPPEEWDLFSATELHIFDTFLQDVLNVTVSGDGLSDTASP